MSSTGGWGIPGVGATLSTVEKELLWGGSQGQIGALWKSDKFSGAMRDAGNTPTTVIRPGLLLGRVTSTGELEEWDADASDGTQDISGILDWELMAQDFYATNADRLARLLVRAPIKASELLIQGVAFVGHIDEFLARRQLTDMGFVFDDDPAGFLAGRGSRMATVTGTSDTLTPAENGTTLFYNNAASVTVTLPTIQPGLEYTAIRAADEEFIVASGEGDNIVMGNDLEADSVTVTTAGEQIGASYTFRSVYVGTALKWLIRINTVPFSTDDYLAKTLAS